MQCVYDEKAKVYKVYNRVYEIGNSGGFVLPMTGGTEKLSDYFVLLAGLACFSLAAVWEQEKWAVADVAGEYNHHCYQCCRVCGFDFSWRYDGCSIYASSWGKFLAVSY